MNISREMNENKFELSMFRMLVMGVYMFIVELLVEIPFLLLKESKYVTSHKSLELIVSLSSEIIPRFLVVLIVLELIKEYYKLNFKISYARNFNFRLLLSTVFLMIGFFLWFQTLFMAMVVKFPVLQSFAQEATKLDENFYVDIIVSVVVAPIYEEILMRGIILEGLLNKYKPIIGIIVSAAIFGAMHFNILTFINATVGGIVLGTIYYKTRSLVLCIVCHMLHNSIINFLQYFGQYMEGVDINIITFLIGIAIFTISAIFFERCLKKMKKDDVNLKKNIA
ncbi:CPBP family intramembrane glutamic endopeptidase [Clostridium oceanicum]|uniref:CPBP family intramembrane metalloprotease n=1 Tax=Clostridium oceanicum TaxID=1543 RepID=A0ABN1JKA0_9CLOT